MNITEKKQWTYTKNVACFVHELVLKYLFINPSKLF